MPLIVTRRHKYNAVRTTAYGRVWASKAELRRYTELLLLGQAKQIRNLELQPRFPLVVDGVRVGRFTADFRFSEHVEGTEDVWRDVVEDVKGFRVRDYVLRAALFCALYPAIRFREVR